MWKCLYVYLLKYLSRTSKNHIKISAKNGELKKVQKTLYKYVNNNEYKNNKI